MSYYSTIDGRIEARTEKGAAVIDRLFESWTQPENERYGALVHVEGNGVEFAGYYRNAGRVIEPCITELLKMGELQSVEVEESTTDGFTAEYRYFIQDGRPTVRVDDETHNVHETRTLGD
jgi:hypothetical protein